MVKFYMILIQFRIIYFIIIILPNHMACGS